MKWYSISLCVMGTVTKATEFETSSGVIDGKRGLLAWDKDSEHEMNKGYQQAHRHWTQYRARACKLHLYLCLCQFSFVPQRKKVNAFWMGGISPADITEKRIPVYEPLAEEIRVEVMLLREHNSKCCKTCSSPSPEMTTRKGRKAWKRNIKFQKADVVFFK